MEHAVEGPVLVEAACNSVSIHDVDPNQGSALHEAGVSGAQVVDYHGVVPRAL